MSDTVDAFNLHEINTFQKINAAVVNISGRQRMLSQRTALLALRLVSVQVQSERDTLRQALSEALNLMEQAHNGLIYGDSSLNLPGQPSPAIKALYFEPPLHLDHHVRKYIAEVRALLQTADSDLAQAQLSNIVQTASTELLNALDRVVSQYQRESEAEALKMTTQQVELYHQSQTATVTAQAQAQQLEQALAELRQMQTQLIQSEKMSSLGQLVAGIAHEINNPVNFISGNLPYINRNVQELLQLLQLYQTEYLHPSHVIREQRAGIDLEFLQQDLPKLLQSMQVGVDRIDEIVQALRNFSRLDEAEVKRVNLHDGIESTLMLLQNRLKKQTTPAIQVIRDYGDLPLIECYAGQLNQVFMNILSNAIDALEDPAWQPKLSPLNPPTIQIRTEERLPESVRICIANNGADISIAAQRHLFNPFFTTKPVGTGTGMGLAICYQVVTQHGGTLHCFSAPGKGVEFVVELPTRQPKKPAF